MLYGATVPCVSGEIGLFIDLLEFGLVASVLILSNLWLGVRGRTSCRTTICEGHEIELKVADTTYDIKKEPCIIILPSFRLSCQNHGCCP